MRRKSAEMGRGIINKPSADRARGRALPPSLPPPSCRRLLHINAVMIHRTRARMGTLIRNYDAYYRGDKGARPRDTRRPIDIA